MTEHEANVRRPMVPDERQMSPDERRRARTERIRKRLEVYNKKAVRGGKEEAKEEERGREVKRGREEGGSLVPREIEGEVKSGSRELSTTTSHDVTADPLPPPAVERDPSAGVPEARDPQATAVAQPFAFQLPDRAPSRRNSARMSFLVVVVLPTLIAALYYCFIASHQYETEFRFEVSQVSPSGADPSGGLQGGMGALLGGMGLSTGVSNQNYVVVDYLTSNQALADMRKNGIDVAKLFSDPHVDWFSRLSSHASKEKLNKYWQNMITTNYDPISGLADITVRAFSAKDVLAIGNALVKQSEQLVNNVAQRAKIDTVNYAEAEVQRADKEMQDIRAQLDKFRRTYGVIDPGTGLVASNTQVTATLQANLAQLETQLNQLLMQNVSQTAPTAAALRLRIDATKQQLAKETGEVSKDAAKKSALTAIVAQYEKLDLQRQYAQARLISTQQALDTAKTNAAAQSLYLTPYVRPDLPENAAYPQKLLSISVVGICMFAFWLIGSLIHRAAKGH